MRITTALDTVIEEKTNVKSGITAHCGGIAGHNVTGEGSGGLILSCRIEGIFHIAHHVQTDIRVTCDPLEYIDQAYQIDFDLDLHVTVGMISATNEGEIRSCELAVADQQVKYERCISTTRPHISWYEKWLSYQCGFLNVDVKMRFDTFAGEQKGTVADCTGNVQLIGQHEVPENIDSDLWCEHYLFDLT